MHIAVIITCHNRKAKTLQCLSNLFAAGTAYNNNNRRDELHLAVFLTDDGCTDGTAEAVEKLADGNEIHIIKGDGNLFWAGGMRAAWNEALKERKKWDFYLLANDDTFAFDTLFDELFASHQYCLSHYGRAGLYSGVTCKPGHPDVTTYGGDKVDWLCRLHRVKPNGQPQPVNEANANLLLVPAEVVEQIGIFYEGYTHSSADYDYTRQAVKHHIPVLITGNNCGECDYDHDSGKIEGEKVIQMNFRQRRAFLNHPLHSDKEYITFVRRNMPMRLPVTWVLRKLRLYFPKIYYGINRLRKIR